MTAGAWRVCCRMDWYRPVSFRHETNVIHRFESHIGSRETGPTDSLPRFRRFCRGWKKEIQKLKWHRRPKAHVAERGTNEETDPNEFLGHALVFRRRGADNFSAPPINGN